MSLGINKDVLILRLQVVMGVLCVVWRSMFCCVQLVLIVLGMVLCVMSLMDVGCTEVSSVTERGNFTYVPVFGKDNIIMNW